MVRCDEESRETRIEIHPIAHGRLVVVDGALDARSAHALLDAIAAAAANGPDRCIVVDLDEATDVDAFGRAALRRGCRRATHRRKTVLVVAGVATRRRLGDIGRLLDARRLVSSRRIAEAAAIAASVH